MKNQLSKISLQVPVFVRSGRFMRTGDAWGLFILEGGETMEENFDVEDFRNSKWGEIKAVTESLIKMEHTDELNAHWQLCYVLKEKVNKTDEFLKQYVPAD